MLEIRRSEERGHSERGWLESHHTFSFDSYYDSRFMGFRSLRVINEDRVQPAEGFGTHPHQDMEIVTYVLDGSLEHRDSMGNGSVIQPGEVQRMSAGTGVTHSEFNPSRTALVHFLQIWLLPEANGLSPSYEQRGFPESERRNRLCLVASREGRAGSIRIHQDADLYAARLSPGAELEHVLRARRHAWVQVALGSIRLNGSPLEAGDGAALSDERSVRLKADGESEILLFDLA